MVIDMGRGWFLNVEMSVTSYEKLHEVLTSDLTKGTWC